ncbi:hypothetical protein BpHYR1_010334 [Brachionus plicatilis]|uniref:Uncharacterized protein n=1 Tax=Brachionus plicatilis TaxID=10195 RepID=A0A3M7T8J3_BRAPC|nr:hypothetical protein BpHYR1_010334 [Brachionus plicatilis]
MKKTNTYYRSIPMTKDYQNLTNKCILYSYFVKYAEKKISDLCDYCEKNKELKKKLYKFALENGYEGVEDFLLIKEFLTINKSRNDLTELMNMFTKIESINLHFEISKRQSEAYNSMCLNLDEDNIFIEMDWKQKIMVGLYLVFRLSPRQPSNEYRNQLSRTVFGFGVYYKINNFVECMNIDLVSVVKNFRNLDVFKKIERKKYIIWADTGTHFRCSELIDYLFQELSKENIKHEKNRSDQHFSALTNFVNQESFHQSLLVPMLLILQDLKLGTHIGK